jgi:RNA polymerase sigma factor FliA
MTQHMTAPDDQELWQRYRDGGDLTARDRLVEKNMSLVRSEARRFHQRAGAGGAQYDDLLSAAAVGLLQAVERFDPARGWQLSTFAMRRIRGAMLDQLRQQAGVPRGSLVRARRIAVARARVEGRLGRHARETEVAQELGVDAGQYHAWHRDIARVVSPTESWTGSAGADAQAESGPAWLTEAIQRLPPTERTVITLGYYEDLPGRDIARALGVSESRVSQYRSRALSRLREAGSLREAV